MDVTPEVIEALRVLRSATHLHEGLGNAIHTLDNAGIFAAIDEATGYDIDPAPERVSKCTCPATTLRRGFGHLQACPGDPAEWGDMAYTVVSGGDMRDVAPRVKRSAAERRRIARNAK